MISNPDVVKRLMDHLIKAFEEFAEQEVNNDPTSEGLTYIDALMGSHNFYKRVILDLESRTDNEIIHKIAIQTLIEAFNEIEL